MHSTSLKVILSPVVLHFSPSCHIFPVGVHDGFQEIFATDVTKQQLSVGPPFVLYLHAQLWHYINPLWNMTCANKWQSVWRTTKGQKWKRPYRHGPILDWYTCQFWISRHFPRRQWPKGPCVVKGDRLLFQTTLCFWSHCTQLINLHSQWSLYTIKVLLVLFSGLVNS